MKSISHKKNNQGFSLIELMVVILILGLLIGIVGPRLIGRTDDAKVSTAKIQIEGLASALKMYKLDNGTYPSTEQGLEALVTMPQSGNIPKNGARAAIWKRERFPRIPGTTTMSTCFPVRMTTSTSSRTARMVSPAGRNMTRTSPAGPWMNNLPALAARSMQSRGGTSACRMTGLCRGVTPLRYQPSGFTLIELMVVMLLITIVLAVAIPRLDSSMAQDPQKQVTRWMVNSARTLRTMAVERQQIYTLVIDLDEHRMWAIDAQMDEEAMAAAAEKGFTFPNSIKLADVEFPDKDRISSGTAAIQFYPGGYPTRPWYTSNMTKQFVYHINSSRYFQKLKRLDEWVSY